VPITVGLMLLKLPAFTGEMLTLALPENGFITVKSKS